MKLSALAILAFFFTLAGCSFYKSEGRKKFEMDSSQRFNILEEFHCYQENPLAKNRVQEQLIIQKTNSTSSMNSGFSQNETFPQKLIQAVEFEQNIVLVVKDSDTQDFCLTNPILKSDFLAKKQQIFKEISTWP